MKRVRNIPGGPTPATLPEGRMAIYLLRDPETRRIHWVGATVRPRVRWLAHAGEARGGFGGSDAKNEWIAGLLARDLLPVMEIVEIFDGSGKGDAEHERPWIAQFMAAGEPLFNAADRPIRAARRTEAA